MLKAAGVVFASQGLVTVILFARNILIARLISVEDFGIASSFAIAFAFIESATNVGLNRLVVQDRDGDDQLFVDVLHLFQVVRGLLGAGVTLILAAPYAGLLNIPEVTWAFMALAWVPFIRGFLNLDMFRIQRRMDFQAFARASVLSALSSIPVVVLIYLIIGDYQTMLWAIIGHQTVLVVLSHLMAKRPFGLAFEPTILRRALGFGTPLLLNGLVMFTVINGDRLIVGNQLGVETLAWFSAVFMITYTPTTVMANTMQSVLLPRLSGLQNTREEFLVAAEDAMALGFLIGIVVAVGIALFGPILLLLAFGNKFAPGLEILLLMGVVQAVRISKLGLSMIALARGTTTNMLYANLARLLVLPAGLGALMLGHGIEGLLLASLGGELLGLLVSKVLLHRQIEPSLKVPWILVGLSGLTFGLILVLDALHPPTVEILGNVYPAQLALLILVGLAALSTRPVRNLVRGKKHPAQAQKPEKP
ncbi:polysaccharide biosynthesis protein (plasmid) [Dinoroseobacter shibae DFL 12 = DSM 16493]|jgi:O-antigen/teichoic acid export membrane protein|uniref:Polysaccharide biosynthesis protein n=1 Tax=Dinoroseobacter shibae (strain DSM 16493 / NCIMB 14021 / DFL 12) TaxID=398580 RepID=A8LUC5_DINSH|nr:oligosaccharide flippase family protein [Dinoroseobacter shibae]ABV95842.1 polysaccharide biosynthesis protein [Dinoroseobacter shibae DFL 12 = DSM 16493]URF49088.1 oligosaccharide flippase family protein [Dinoroseobacter shibae]URF53397.1 oligosaccharide flippase family protein [Dinoroseobacter shibae]